MAAITVAYITKIAPNNFCVRRAPHKDGPAAEEPSGIIDNTSTLDAAKSLAERTITGGRAFRWVREDLAGGIEGYRGEL